MFPKFAKLTWKLVNTQEAIPINRFRYGKTQSGKLQDRSMILVKRSTLYIYIELDFEVWLISQILQERTDVNSYHLEAFVIVVRLSLTPKPGLQVFFFRVFERQDFRLNFVFASLKSVF